MYLSESWVGQTKSWPRSNLSDARFPGLEPVSSSEGELSRSSIKKGTGDQPWTRDSRLAVNLLGASIVTTMPGGPWFWRLLVFEAVPLRPHRYCPPSLEFPLRLRLLPPPDFCLRTTSHRCASLSCLYSLFSLSPRAQNNSQQSTPNRINKDALLQDVPSILDIVDGLSSD